MEYFYIDPKDIEKLLAGFAWKEPKKRIRTRPFKPERLREVISDVSNASSVSEFPKACHKLVWELMKCQTHIKKMQQDIERLESTIGKPNQA